MTDRAPGEDRRAIASWSLYDWANSAFTTLVVTFVYGTYFTKSIAADELTGTTQWALAITISAVLIAVSSPVLGAVADRSGARRLYLIISTLTSVAATAALTFVRPSQEHAALLALTIFVIGNVAFEVGMVFYNAFLPSIAAPERIGRVSGYGWGLGYLGGLACMVVGLLVFVRDTPLFGISTVEGFHYRATNLLVAAWFLVFSIPAFLFLRDERTARARIDVRGALSNLARTVRRLRRHREVVKFLLARLIYNDGLVTIFAFGGIYAAGTFDMTLSEVMVFGIALNAAAGLGALAFGFVDDRLGGKTTILLSLAALSVATVMAVLAPNRLWLWVAGLLVGIFVGPNQSASRSLMGRFTPARHRAEFYGFFAFSGKITSFLGPISLGVATQMFHSQRAGIATVLAFFLVGGAVLLGINERRGVEAARDYHEERPDRVD